MSGEDIRRAFAGDCGMKLFVDLLMFEVSGSLSQTSRRERWRGEGNTAAVRTLWQLNSYDRIEEPAAGEDGGVCEHRAQGEVLVVCRRLFMKGGISAFIGTRPH